MSLIQSTPLITGGPAWATNIESDLVLIDQHDHSLGKGVPIPVSSLNVNGDLSMSGFSVVNLLTTDYNSQPATLIATSAVYVVNGDLYYNNGSGIPIRITAGTAVNVAGVGGITGLAGTLAAVTYSDLTKTFTFTQDANKTANIIAGTLTLSEPGVIGPSLINLKSPIALAGSYDITLPTALPVTTKYLQIAPTGQLIAANEIDGVTLEEVGGLIRIKTVTNASLANMPAVSVKGNATLVAGAPTDIAAGADDLVLLRRAGALIWAQTNSNNYAVNSVQTPSILDGAVTQAKLGAQSQVRGNIASGTLVGTGTTVFFSQNFTAITGRRIHVSLTTTNPSLASFLRSTQGGNNPEVYIDFSINAFATVISSLQFGPAIGSGNQQLTVAVPPSAFSVDLLGTVPGTTYTITARIRIIANAAASWAGLAFDIYET